MYQVEPRGSGKVCAICSSLDYQTCVGLYDSWPGNTITLSTWYQSREIQWCRGWFGVSCIYWMVSHSLKISYNHCSNICFAQICILAALTGEVGIM